MVFFIRTLLVLICSKKLISEAVLVLEH